MHRLVHWDHLVLFRCYWCLYRRCPFLLCLFQLGHHVRLLLLVSPTTQKKNQDTPLYPLAEDVGLDEEEENDTTPETRGFLGLSRVSVRGSDVAQKSNRQVAAHIIVLAIPR
jgi:hypothetical protein